MILLPVAVWYLVVCIAVFIPPDFELTGLISSFAHAPIKFRRHRYEMVFPLSLSLNVWLICLLFLHIISACSFCWERTNFFYHLVFWFSFSELYIKYVVITKRILSSKVTVKPELEFRYCLDRLIFFLSVRTNQFDNFILNIIFNVSNSLPTLMANQTHSEPNSQPTLCYWAISTCLAEIFALFYEAHWWNV